MTGYHIRIGYNSRHRTVDVWAALKHVCEDVRMQTGAIVAESLRERDGVSAAELRQFAELFATGEDSTLTYEDQHKQLMEVMLLASGGGVERAIKEQTRRAFCRLVLFEMHRRGMEVDVVVA